MKLSITFSKVFDKNDHSLKENFVIQIAEISVKKKGWLNRKSYLFQ